MASYLVVSELFAPTHGGTAVWFAEVYARLGERNDVITAAVPGAAAVDARHPARIHRLPLTRVAWLRPESLGLYARLFGSTLWCALRRRYSAIHAGRALPEGLVAWLAGRLSGHRVVVYAHGEELTGSGQGAKYRVMRWVLRHADQVIANSDRTREILLAMGVPAANIAVVYPGVDCSRYSPAPSDALRARLGLGAETRIVLSVGRLQRRKGFATVLAALPALLLRGLDVHYVLVGSGEQAAELHALAARLGLTNRFHLLPDVSSAALPDCYRSCEVFAMPNIDVDGDTEGFGMVFLEAAACGRPALAGTAGGTGSAVLDGVTGLRVDGTDLQAVGAALARLLEDQPLASALGEAALARVRAQFDWPRVAEQTARLAGVAPASGTSVWQR